MVRSKRSGLRMRAIGALYPGDVFALDGVAYERIKSKCNTVNALRLSTGEKLLLPSNKGVTLLYPGARMVYVLHYYIMPIMAKGERR